MTEFKKASENLSRTAQVNQLNDNDSILEGRISEHEFINNELDQIYQGLAMPRQYVRMADMGHSATTYSSWAHVQAENGYSIWSYPVTVFADGASNLLFIDNVKMTYKRQADSLASTSFNKVYNYFTNALFDDTTEAGTEGGVAFSFLQNIDGACVTCLYLGDSAKFKAIDFDLETSGGGLGIKASYWNGSAWGIWDAACTLSGFVDNTENMHYSGRVEFSLPSDWAQSQVNGASNFWMKITTSSAPTQIPWAYHIKPGNSVPTLLSLSSVQIADKEWAWCYFSGNIYCTLPNGGDPYYEGDDFVKSSSSVETKQNYFINNHAIRASYLRSDYSYIKPVGEIENFIELWDVPQNYTGAGGKTVKVKSAVDGLEFVDVAPAASFFTQLGDAPSSFSGAANKTVRVNAAASALEFVNIPPAASFFTELGDVPQNYSGAGGKFVKVNSGATALEFVSISDAACYFTKLADVPQSYSGEANKRVVVNAAETGLSFTDSVVISGTPADHSYTGMATSTYNAGCTIAALKLVYMGSASKWMPVDSNAVATCKGLLAISLEAKNDGEAMRVALPGSFVRDDTWTWTVGATLYAGETSGGMQEAIPTGADSIIRVVGFAVTAAIIFFNPSSDQQSTVA